MRVQTKILQYTQPEFRRPSQYNTEMIKIALAKKIIICDPLTAEIYGIKGKPLSQKKNFFGYAKVQFKVNGRNVTAYTHKIIWISEKHEVPIDHEIDHISGDKTDNRITNLQALHWRANLQKVQQQRHPFQTAF